MVTINENEKLSRNIEMDDKMKSLLNKIETEKKNKIVYKSKELEIESVRNKYANNPNKLQSELKELNKIQVIDKNLHENNNKILLYDTGEVETVGTLKVGDQIRQTHIRFRNISDYIMIMMKLMEMNTEMKKTNGWFMLKMMFCVLLSVMPDILKQWKKSLNLA